MHLCLHGASGLSREVISRCISLGMHFVGYGTDPLYRFFNKIDEIRKRHGEKFVDPSQIIIPARDEMQKEIEEKIDYIKSGGKAWEIINLYKNLQHEKTGRTTVFDKEKLVRDITVEVLKQISSRKK
jgi:hypothetical protein